VTQKEDADCRILEVRACILHETQDTSLTPYVFFQYLKTKNQFHLKLEVWHVMRPAFLGEKYHFVVGRCHAKDEIDFIMNIQYNQKDN
jgi:hypothetical protein